METTLTGQSERAFMAEARERGYKVNLVFVGIEDVMMSRSRVVARVRRGGHSVPVEDLERRFSRSMAHLADAMAIAHRTLVVDNSGKRRRLILSRENGRTKRVSSKLPQWAKDAIPVKMRRVMERGMGM
jgi:predicted ABC-type ATPase